MCPAIPLQNVHLNSNKEQSDSQAWHVPEPPGIHQGYWTSLTTLPLVGVEQGFSKEAHPSSNYMAFENCKGSNERLLSTAVYPEALEHQEYHTSYHNRMNPWVPTPNAVTMFQGAHGFYIGGHPRFINNFTVNEQSNPGWFQGFGNFAQFVSLEALHNSYIQNFDRNVDQVIREKTLNQLQEWFDDPAVTEQIVWLHGPANIGKTAIALEIAQQEKVVATFFFNRWDPGRNDGNRLFPTLAWQLAAAIPDVKTQITYVLNQRPDLPKKRIEEQFEYLVAQPFAALKKVTSEEQLSCLVVIIDGIDGCADIGLQRRILKVIGKAIMNRRVPLRFIVSSRPDVHIQDICNQFQCPVRCIDLANFDPAEEIRKRERIVRKREKNVRKKEEELKEKLKERVEEDNKKEYKARKKEEEAKKKEGEARRKTEAKRRHEEAQRLEEGAGRKDEEAKRLVEVTKQREEEARRNGDEVRLKTYKKEWETRLNGQESVPASSPSEIALLDTDLSEEERRQIKEQIYQSTQKLFQEVEELFKCRMQEAESDEERAYLEWYYKWETGRMRSQRAEEYHRQLELEQQQRKWAMGQRISDHWMEILMQDQRRIMESFKPTGSNPGASSSSATNDVQHDEDSARSEVECTASNASDHVVRPVASSSVRHEIWLPSAATEEETSSKFTRRFVPSLAKLFSHTKDVQR